MIDIFWMTEYTEYTLSVLCIRGVEEAANTRTKVLALYKDGQLIVESDDDAMWSLWDYAKWAHQAGRYGDTFEGYQTWKVKNMKENNMGHFIPAVLSDGTVVYDLELGLNPLTVTVW